MNPPDRPVPTAMARAGWLVASIAIDLVYLAATPILLLLFLVASRGFTRPKLRRGLLSKLGFGLEPRQSAAPLIWVHAVSVGEVNTAAPLVEALRRRRPELEFCISVSTFTGLEVAQRRFGEGALVIYAPLDFSFVVRRFLGCLKPRAMILIELELWPNLLLCFRQRGVPVLVANGRLSERSARRYRWGRGLTRALFNLPEAIGSQNEASNARFLEVGVEPARLKMLGNLKHDREPSPLVTRAPQIRAQLGWSPGEALVLVGGSTHPGEESALCAAYSRLKPQFPGLKLILVPRHVERLAGDELGRWGAPEPVVRWSTIRGSPGTKNSGGSLAGILVVDTLGELEVFYAMADIVFVGGSLIRHGGQNLLEPARLARPIVFGPFYQNFQEEGDLLLAAGGAIRVSSSSELEARLPELLGSSEERARLARSALEVTNRLGGAVNRHLEWVESLLFFSKVA